LFFYFSQVVCRLEFSDQNQYHAVDSRGAKHVPFLQPLGICAITKDHSQIWYQDQGIGGSSEPGDQFAFSLAAGDFNKDGINDLAIGVPGEAIGTKSEAGAANVLYGSSSGLSKAGSQIWYQDQGIGGSSEPGDRFGASLTAGGFNKDSIDDLAIGVPGEAIETKSEAGAANVLYGSI
jgi:hypothetical protein